MRNLLPVVERELRVTARQKALYVHRGLLAFVAMGIAGMLMFFMWRLPPSRMGISVFYTLSCLAFIHAATVGIWITSDCISQERREGTLGLLFLTDLGGLDIILGKLTATSLKALTGLLAIFPVLAIPLLLGSVESHELWRVMLVLGNTMLLSLAAGIFVSTLSHSPKSALVGTFLMVVALLGGAPLLLWLIGFLGGESLIGEGVFQKASLHSAIYGLILGFQSNYLTEAASYWQSLWINFFLTIGFISAASILLPRTWQSEGRAKPKRATIKNPLSKQAQSAQIQGNPIAWLHQRSTKRWFNLWLPWLVGLLFWGWASYVHGSLFYAEPSSWVMTAYLSSVILKLMISSEMAYRLSDDRRSGALELLFATSITTSEMIQGHRQALHGKYRGPIILVSLLNAGFGLLLMLWDGFDTKTTCMVLAHLMLLWLDLRALFWFGLWRSLKSPSGNHANRTITFFALTLPWIVYVGMTLFSFQIFSVLFFGNRPTLGLEPGTIILATWFLIQCPWAIGLAILGRREITSHFRVLATSTSAQHQSLPVSISHQGVPDSPTT